MSALFKVWRSSRLFKDLAVLTLRTSIVLGVMLAAGTLVASMQAYAGGSTHQNGSPTVQTTEGPVQGFRTEEVTEFLGIPYAEPPVSTNPTAPPCSPTNLRWCPPVPHAPWHKVLQATAFGSNCPQNTNHPYSGPANITNEDCLFLNVYTPDIGRNARLPVIFFLSGGGNREGSSTDYDGSKLAAQGHTVVVTINFRLASVGWLAVPALDTEGHLFGDYGLLDQLLGLKWVQQNIANFGGDPNNVTVGGQSAGSGDTESLMVSPLAKGLFQRAILESGTQEPTLLSTAEATGTTFANEAGCDAANGYTTNPQIAACLRALSITQIVTKLILWTPYIADGTILPLQNSPTSPTQPGVFYTSFQSGHYNHMPIISGNVENEDGLALANAEYDSQPIDTVGVPWAPPGPPIIYSAAQYAAAIAAFPTTITPYTSPLTVQQWVSAHYPLISSTAPGPQLSMDKLYTDQTMTCPQRRVNKLIATGPSPSPVYAYEFDDQTAPFYYPPLSLPDFESLAYHTGDLQYLFNDITTGIGFHGGPSPPSVKHALNPKQKNLSDQLVAAWTNLAWTGNPNGKGNISWPRYQGSNRNSYYLLENIAPSGLSRQTDAQFAARHNCDFWETYSTP